MSTYDFAVKASDGSRKCLSDYKGKVLLTVNIATSCGYIGGAVIWLEAPAICAGEFYVWLCSIVDKAVW